jgi:parvulin-like peptidyl-prolyl isomerase
MVRGQVSPEFEWVAFQLKVGEITPEPVDTPAGFQIIKRVG